MSKFLTRDQFVTKANRRRIVECPVPEFAEPGEEAPRVRLREILSSERVDIELAMLKEQKGGGTRMDREAYAVLRGRLLVLSLVGDDDEPLFAPDEYLVFRGMASGGVERLFEAARQLSGLSQSDVETMAGNSGTAPSGGSPSNSASRSASSTRRG